MANRHSVTDEGDLRAYYAAIPNIVLMLGLNPFELALYVHFKQAAGDKGGVCWKSRATIARESGMSSGMVTKARTSLERPRLELGGKPLIRVKDEPSKHGGKPTCQVTVTDLWAVNMSKFSTSQYDIEVGTPSLGDVATSPHDEQRHHTTIATSPQDHKEELLKKNQEEGKERQREKRADTQGSRLPDEFCLNSELREWAALNAPHVDLNLAMAEFCDYWRAVPGTRGRKLDWAATWRNRMREMEGRARKNGNGTNQPGGYQTASERRSASFKRQLEIVDELRRASVGAVDENVRGQSFTSRR